MRSARLAAAALAVAMLGLSAAHAQQGAEAVPPKYSVVVTLSAKAAAKMTATKEQTVVDVTYSGDPNAAGKKKVTEFGILLGEEQVKLGPTGGTAAFVGKGFKPAEVKFIKPGSAKVLVNVFSARLGNEDNLLDCGLFEGSFAEAAAKPVAIACKLIGEP